MYRPTPTKRTRSGSYEYNPDDDEDYLPEASRTKTVLPARKKKKKGKRGRAAKPVAKKPTRSKRKKRLSMPSSPTQQHKRLGKRKRKRSYKFEPDSPPPMTIEFTSEEDEPDSAPEDAQYYVCKEDDTIQQIAKNFRLDADELLALNHKIKDLTKTARLQYQTYIRMPSQLAVRRKPKISASQIVVVLNGRRMRKADVMRQMRRKRSR